MKMTLNRNNHHHTRTQHKTKTVYLGVVKWFQTLSLVGSNPSSGQQGTLTWSRWPCVCQQDPQLKGRRQSRSQQYWEDLSQNAGR